MPASNTARKRPSEWTGVTSPKPSVKKDDSAHIKIDGEPDGLSRSMQRRVERPMQQGEAEDQSQRPHAHEDQDRQRTVQAEERASPLGRSRAPRQAAQSLQENWTKRRAKRICRVIRRGKSIVSNESCRIKNTGSGWRGRSTRTSIRLSAVPDPGKIKSATDSHGLNTDKIRN